MLKRICNRIRTSDRIDIYGNGISYILAQSAAFKFATLGMECAAYDSVNAHFLSAGKTKKTVSFVITFTGANKSMIDTARYFKGDDRDICSWNCGTAQRGDPQMVPRDRGDPLPGLSAEP